MNKGVITLMAGIFGTLGAYIPVLAGWDPTGLGGPSIFGGLVGGLFGIWLAVKIRV
ncbi:MAG: hypothetical protein Q7T74_03610 [Candidatus Saccharibacteria bacterium]|nr:hypothetical protein [Candidatus Saccharibacteria bacterium]